MNSGKRPMDVQVTTLSKLLEERTRIANERSKTLGTLTVSTPLTIPRTSQPSTVKQSTLVRWSYIDLEQAKELKEQFLAKNDELNPSFLEFKWTPFPVKL